MGNVGFENLKELALALRDTYGLESFIETGTYKAYTTTWAAENFKRVTSIELDKSWYNRAEKMFSENKTVRLIQGDSAIELPKVIKRLKKPALLWLDAHWCKDEKANRHECPLREELTAIRDSGVGHFILIDDARLFQNPPNEDWPTMAQVGGLMPDNYVVTVWKDAVIAVPGEAAVIVKRVTSPTPKEPEVVVLTSNKYLHCLPGFAYLFNKFWPNQSAKVVRYDVRPPKLPPNFTNYAIGYQDNFTWSQGLLKYLEDHQGELILLMLEDYFINGAVRVNDIKAAWELMLTRPQIAKIDLTDDRLKVTHVSVDKSDPFGALGMVASGGGTQFQTSLQAAIWRVDFLKRFLEPTENPWQFEKNGTRRVIAARESGTFDGLILGFKNPPLSYVNAVGGEGNHPRLWDTKKIPPWMVDELSRKGLM